MNRERRKYIFVTAVGCAFSLFHIYTSYFGVLSGMRQRIVHLAFTLFLIFWIYPFKKGTRSIVDRIVSGIFLLASTAALVYLFIEDPGLPFREGDVYPQDIFFGFITILAVLEATRRTTGWALPIVSSIFMVYAYTGPYLPGILGHRGFSISRILGLLFLTTEGVFGIALYVSSTFIVLFIILAAFLQKSGIGKFFIDIAYGWFGRIRGGPAKVAVVASGFFGSFSGSAIANVVGTGTFTIPLMKRTGYSPTYAGAVEAVASTGGQFMPPIMASAAFVIAEILGVGYIDVAIAAALPAILYYFSIFMQVDFEAAKLGLKAVSMNGIPNTRQLLKQNSHLILPLIVLIYMMGIWQITPMRAAFWTILCTIVVSMVRRSTRLNVLKTIEALKDGAEGALSVATACACIGIIVGVLMLTGLGLRLSGMLLEIAKGNLFLLLVLCMITSIILGMGVPTLACYLFLALVVCPALTEIGVKPMAAHLFMFYFGIISCITPPVALAAYTAAGLAGSDPMKTGYQACRLGLVAFVVPYVFVYYPALLIHDAKILDIVKVFLACLIAIIALAGALEGYLLALLTPILRIILFFCAMSIFIIPGNYSNLAGITVIGLMGALQYWKRKKSIQKA